MLNLLSELVWHCALTFVIILPPFSISVLSFCIYQLYLHPLSKYPGPWLAKLTNGYAAYHAWIGDIHIDMWRCHEKYGDVVRYAPNRLLINTATCLQDVYGHRSNVQKSKAYNTLVHRASNILTLIDKKQHSRRRRVISQAFSDSSIQNLEPAILAQIYKFVSILSEAGNEKAGGVDGWSPPINIAKWCDYLAFDIMASVVFSGTYDMLGKTDNRYVLDSIVESNIRMGVLYEAPEIASWKIHKRFFSSAIAARNRFIPFVTRMVADRLQLSKTSSSQQDHKHENDVFSFLTKAKDPETGQGLAMHELGAESTTLIIAGSDTTSTIIAGTLFYLIGHPEVYARAKHEVRATFASESEIRLGAKLNRCTYLRACINETLRMSPSVGAALWRETPADGVTIDGHYLPPGCDVGVGIYSIHHNSKYYRNPFTYDPDRWLQTDGDCYPVNDAFTPFSRGPRSCIGKGLAMVELMLTFACVLWSLDFKAAGIIDPDKEFPLHDHVTCAKDGPVLHFRKRS